MKTSDNKMVIMCLALCMLVALAGTGCGKKSAPTMKSFEKPDVVKDIRLANRDGKIDISWAYTNQKREVTVKGFYIDKAEAKGGYETIATLPADAVRYTDADIKVNTQYRYKVRVFNTRGVAVDDSPELKVVPVAVPAPVQGLSYRLTNDAVEISWNKGAEGVLFNVYRSFDKGVYPVTPLNEKPLETPFFKDELNAQKKVYYAVIAVVQTTLPNESALSEELEIDPAAFKPAAPTDIRYIKSDYRGYISWKDNAESWVSGYKVYRKKGNGTFEPVADVTVPVFLDEEPVTEETSYYVTALGPVKESEPSAIVTGKP